MRPHGSPEDGVPHPAEQLPEGVLCSRARAFNRLELLTP